MSWVCGPDGEYALISVEQWEQLDAALNDGDLERARGLLVSWRPETPWVVAEILAGSWQR